MSTVYKYRIRCTTDSKYEYIWAESEPTTCPTNTAHTIDSSQTVIVEKNDPDELKIKEESVPTGGNFATHTLDITAAANTITSTSVSFPFQISALAVEFVSEATHEDDVINLTVGEDTVTGAITADVAPASAWSAQNYVVGNVVTYTHPTFGSRVYTCILNTVSNEIPTDVTYWKHGLEISVGATVIANACAGYYIKLYDGTNTDDVQRVISVDSTNSKIYVESNLTNSFAAATPTYIQQTVYSIKDFIVGPSWEYRIGESKIGGSAVPKDTLITIHYDNKSPSTQKKLKGTVEYLY